MLCLLLLVPLGSAACASPPIAYACSDDADCAAGFRCEAGTCLATSAADAGLPDGREERFLH